MTKTTKGEEMTKVTKRWVSFFSPSLLFAETTDKEVVSFDPNAIQWPDNAYAFRFFQRTDVTDGTQCYTGKARSVGLLYYHPDSKVETFEQVKRHPNSTPMLIRNMEGNKWTHIIWTRWNNWPQPYDKKAMVILKEKANG